MSDGRVWDFLVFVPTVGPQREGDRTCRSVVVLGVAKDVRVEYGSLRPLRLRVPPSSTTEKQNERDSLIFGSLLTIVLDPGR